MHNGGFKSDTVDFRNRLGLQMAVSIVHVDSSMYISDASEIDLFFTLGGLSPAQTSLYRRGIRPMDPLAWLRTLCNFASISFAEKGLTFSRGYLA